MSDEEVVEETETLKEAEPPVESQTEQEAQEEAPESAASSEDAKPAEEAERKQRRKQTAEERIHELNAKLHAERRRRERAEKLVSDNRDRAQAPDPAKFEDLDELSAAQAQASAAKIRQAELEAEATDAGQEAAALLQEAWEERAVIFAEDVPDFEQVAGTAPISEPVADLIKMMDSGPAVAYYLGKHSLEARKISRLSEREAAIALGKIEGKLSQSTPRKVTQAPEPIKTVTPKSSGTKASIHDTKISMKEYSRLRASMPDRLRAYGDPNEKR